MQHFRSFVLTLVGAALALSAFLFAASLGLVLATVLSVVMITSAVAARFAPKPVRATVRNDGRPQNSTKRVWNDGRGTIIDM